MKLPGLGLFRSFRSKNEAGTGEASSSVLIASPPPQAPPAETRRLGVAEEIAARLSRSAVTQSAPMSRGSVTGSGGRIGETPSAGAVFDKTEPSPVNLSSLPLEGVGIDEPLHDPALRSMADAEMKAAVLSRLDDLMTKAVRSQTLAEAREHIEAAGRLVRQGLQGPSPRRIENLAERLRQARIRETVPANRLDEDAPAPELTPSMAPAPERRRKVRTVVPGC